MIRLGLVGLGMMGRHHARVARTIEGVELVALADSFGDAHGVAEGLPVYSTVEELIGHGIDAAICAVPTSLHEEVGLTLAESGVHALIEKPIAATSPAGRRLTEAFARRDLIGAVGHIERFNPALQELKRRLDDGEMGQIYQIATRRQGPFPDRITDVGVALDLASHDLDLTMWIGGAAYERLTSENVTVARANHEDLVSVTGRLANGIVTNHLVNRLSPMKERVTVVTGEAGAFVADTLTADLTFHENGKVQTSWDTVANFRGVSEGNVTRFAFAKQEPLRSEHEAFRDAILGVRQEVVTMEEGLRTLAAVEEVIGSPSSM